MKLTQTFNFFLVKRSEAISWKLFFQVSKENEMSSVIHTYKCTIITTRLYSKPSIKKHKRVIDEVRCIDIGWEGLVL